MNILIIGNGFDLAHNLPTKYTQFLEYIETFLKYEKSTENSILHSSSNICGDRELTSLNQDVLQYIMTLYSSDKDIYDEFLNLVNDNSWIKYFSGLYTEIDKNDGWIDFEKEISKIVQTLNAIRVSNNEQISKGISIHNLTLNKTHARIIKRFLDLENTENSEYTRIEPDAILRYKELLISDLHRLIRSLEIYLCTYVQSIDTNSIDYIKNLNINKVLSFNYTNTYKKIYCPDNPRIDFDYIHGEANIQNNEKNCCLVLGIDEFQKGEEKDLDNEFVQFKKFYQRILKNTGAHYTDWLEEHHARKEQFRSNPSVNVELNVFIIGHSLDITDKEILYSMLINENPNVTIYYHSKKALEDQISNLVKVIGEEELIRRTYGKNQKIKFVPIPKEN